MKKIYLLIPGNPAIASQYQSWIEEIESSNENINVVYATSYVLFNRKINYTEYELGMRKHYEDILLGLETSEKIVILAHSVGSYFALRLLEKFGDKIEKVILLFPYLGHSTLKSMRFVRIPYLIDRVLPLAEFVSMCKNLFSWWDTHVRNISNIELTACLRFGVRQCVYFIKHKLDPHSISTDKNKILFIYTDNDRWCPKETIESLKPVSNYKKVDLPHDFITNQKCRMRMIDELGISAKKD